MKIIFTALVFVSGFTAAAALLSVVLRNAEIKKLKGEVFTGTIARLKEAVISLRCRINSANRWIIKLRRYEGITVLLKMTGRDTGAFLEDFILNEELFAVCGGAAGIILFSNPVTAVLLGVPAFFIPELMLRSGSARKKEDILRELPDAYDIIAAGIEGGLSAQAALARYASGAKGAFGGELLLAVRQIQLGGGFESSLKKMHEKNRISELGGFISAFIQAEKSGGNIKETIRSQADQIRQKRFMALKKKAHEAPVKLLIPLILFIFPVIFIILFGPVMIKLLGGL